MNSIYKYYGTAFVIFEFHSFDLQSSVADDLQVMHYVSEADEKARLNLQRYLQYEKDVAEYVSAGISKTNEIKLDKVKLQKKLNLYFDESSKQKINWQKFLPLPTCRKNFL